MKFLVQNAFVVFGRREPQSGSRGVVSTAAAQAKITETTEAAGRRVYPATSL
jgi:hypothetical protein